MERVAGVMCQALHAAVKTDAVGAQERAPVTFTDEKTVSADEGFSCAASAWWELVSAESDSLGEAKKTMTSERDKE